MQEIYLIFAIILSAFAYRVGGMSKKSAKEHYPWFPQVLVKSWFREVNCTLITLGFYLLFLPILDWWWYVLFSITAYLSTNTYWDESNNKIKDKICKIINWKYPKDNFYLHGFFIGLASMFIFIPAGLWIEGLFRMFVMTLFMGIWCEIFSNDFVEEYGRGGIIQATLPLIRRL